jgi:hypothetical protein
MVGYAARSAAMIDPRSPTAARSYAASRQIGLILGCCKWMTVSDAQQRRAMLEIMRPAFAALRWLNRERFDGSRRIEATINRLEREAEQLADRPVVHPPPVAEVPARCPACGEAPRPPDEWEKIPYCSACLDRMPSLLDIQAIGPGFGTDII